MKPLAALLALLALAAGAAPAAAEQRLATESAPFTADAYGDVIAWSSYDPAAQDLRAARPARRHGGRHRSGRPVGRAVRPRRRARARTASRSSSTRAAATSSSSTPRPAAEQPLAEVNTKGTEVHPSINRKALAFVRTPRGRKARPTLYLRKGGDTRKQPRPKFKETLAIEDVELSDRGLFVVYRTDIVPTLLHARRALQASTARSCATSSTSAAAARTSASS